MTLLLADTFTSSLARLTCDEQKAVKTTAFDLQMNPASPGMQFHRLNKARDRNFWSVRVSSDIRLIVHRTDESLLLCYVDHHDAAYAWAERRKLERHPVTGAMQMVEIRETVRDIEVPRYVGAPAQAPKATPQKRLFDGVEDEVLLSYGVPRDWLADVRQATEDSLLDLASHLPGEAAEVLLTVATGGTVSIQPALTAYWLNTGQPAGDDRAAFEHPEAQRRFRVMENVDDLRRALDAPWEKWTVFLHPAQEALVSRRFNGPARVAGSAGTGKTVVALHRAYRLARVNPTARVLLTTVSETLATTLRVKLGRLAGDDRDVLDRIKVQDITRVGVELHESLIGPVIEPSGAQILDAMTSASNGIKGHRFDVMFLLAEWHEVVDQWQLTTWEAYRTVTRLGRRTRLPESQRAVLWAIFERFRAWLDERGLMTTADALGRVTTHLRQASVRPWDFVVVDESQDMSVAAIRLVAAIAGDRPDGLFFAGDLGQRIYQSPFSWKALGVDIRGRSQTLRVNYRTSHQIRRQADRLLGAEVADVDHNVEERSGTVSVFNGPEPEVRVCDWDGTEAEVVGTWLRARLLDGIAPEEMAVFVRSGAQMERATRAVALADLPHAPLSDLSSGRTGHVAIGTMHYAKGLEFRVVAVMACDDDVLPLQERIEGVTDEADLEDVYDTERQILYVACTRARDWLLVTGVTPGSEFLRDLGESR
jgi:superfamily I DNA/RNA helicase